MFAVLASVAGLSPTPAVAQATDKAKEAARIETECGLKKGTITVTSDQVVFQPSPGEAYDHVDCALTQLNEAGLGKIGFVGNEMDPNAVLRPPLRFIAEGTGAQIAKLVEAVRADKWTIVRSANASDGSTILQFESASKMTNGEAMKLLNRIWKNEFGDLEFGTAPGKLSDRGDYDD